MRPSPGTFLAITVVFVVAILPVRSTAASWSASVGQWQTANMDMPAAVRGSGVQRQAVGLAWEGELVDLPHKISWVHQPVLIRTGRPAHNGYFHQFDVHADRTLGDITLAVTVGVHGSSNMFKHVDFHGDAFVVTFDALHRPEDRQFGIGLFGDYRFDRFRLYPRVLFDLDVGAGALELDLPVAARWRDGRERWSAGIERVGEKWGALDASRNVESAFRLTEWRVGVTRRWQTGNGHGWALTAGVSVDTGVHYQDLVAGSREMDLDPAAFLAVTFKTGR